MDKNILIIIGSPKSQRSNSNVISNNLTDKLSNKNINCSKLYLRKIVGEKDAIMDNINKADVIILISPIYENSVPSTVLDFFETMSANKNSLIMKNREMFVITNSGFPEIEASKSAITTCSLFAKDMNFKWLGGITVAPGTLIDGEELGKTYKKLILALSIAVEDICNDKEISKEVFKLTSKSFLPPLIYCFGGRIIKNKTIKSIGKETFYAKPLEI